VIGGFKWRRPLIDDVPAKGIEAPAEWVTPRQMTVERRPVGSRFATYISIDKHNRLYLRKDAATKDYLSGFPGDVVERREDGFYGRVTTRSTPLDEALDGNDHYFPVKGLLEVKP
jgi:hypothetical protein